MSPLGVLLMMLFLVDLKVHDASGFFFHQTSNLGSSWSHRRTFQPEDSWGFTAAHRVSSPSTPHSVTSDSPFSTAPSYHPTLPPSRVNISGAPFGHHQAVVPVEGRGGTEDDLMVSSDRSGILPDLRDGRTFPTFGNIVRPSMYRPSLFHIVKFPNDECLDATNQTGVCYTGLECKAFGGTGSTSCAKGYGTCCSINRSCNQVTSQKVVYFMNPSYPQSDTSSTYCAMTVEVTDEDVCQMRLDFLEFNIDQPTDGICYGDKMTVTAGGLNAKSIPILCGNNKDQHMYVSVPKGGGSQAGDQPRSLSILFQTNGNGAYRWRIRVTQVSCVRSPVGDTSMSTSYAMNNHISRRIGRDLSRFFTQAQLKITYPAPSGCLQYYTESSGTITSFNYGQYLTGMDYSICIERQPTTCKVTFRPVDTFGLPAFGISLKDTVQTGDDVCTDDYVSIPGGSGDGVTETKDRRCGSLFGNVKGSSMSQPVITRTNGPIVVRFHTGSNYDRSTKSGFKLMYEQSSNCEQQILSDPGLRNKNLLYNPMEMALGSESMPSPQKMTSYPMGEEDRMNRSENQRVQRNSKRRKLD